MTKGIQNFLTHLFGSGRPDQPLARPDQETTTWLTRSDPSRNLHRFYALQLAPTLFGQWALVVEWGRIGCWGKARHQVFPTEELAQMALEKRLRAKTRRGYCLP